MVSGSAEDTGGEKIAAVIEHEEFLLRTLHSDVFRELLAAALRRAGVRDEAAMATNSLLTREDSAPLPTLMAEGVIAYLAQAVESGLAVRRAALAASPPVPPERTTREHENGEAESREGQYTAWEVIDE